MKTQKTEYCHYCGEPIGAVALRTEGKHFHGDERNCFAKYQDTPYKSPSPGEPHLELQLQEVRSG